MLTALLVSGFVGYLLGSLPFGYLVARSRGVDIFAVGSKNPGATNVRRVLGSGPGNLVLTLDALKGAVAAFLPYAYWLVTRDDAAVDPAMAAQVRYCAAAGVVGAFLGHSFSCFTKFRGGKGVATGAGGFAVLFPIGVLVALIVWLLSAGVTRYVSVASILAAVSLPITAIALRQPGFVIGVSIAIAALVVTWHRSNIARLAAGTENKMGRKTAQPKS